MLFAVKAVSIVVALAVVACGRIGFDPAAVPEVLEDGGVLVPDASWIPEGALYISPSGDDTNDGSADSPFRSFSKALSMLVPGSTLVALPGTYGVSSGTGTMAVDCRESSVRCEGAPCAKGEAGAPIVIRALEERASRFVAEIENTTENVSIHGCSHYVVQGFTIIGLDSDNPSWPNAQILESSNIVFRRNLLTRSNRRVNGHLLEVYITTDVLAEENEFYDFNRTAVSSSRSTRFIARRNYTNPRGYGDIVGGYESGNPDSGDSGYTCGHSNSCRFENNVSDGDTLDGFGSGSSIDAPDAVIGAGDGHRYLGNMVLSPTRFGITSRSGCANAVVCAEERVVSDYLLRDNLLIAPSSVGIYLRGVRGATIDHNSILGAISRVDLASENTGMSPTVVFTNTLATAPADEGIQVFFQSESTIDFNNSIGPGGSYSTDGVLGANNMSVEPALGACTHRIPSTSPMSGAGASGSDIGATILNRSEDGTLTAIPLWDAATGQFPCGAIVEGINDSGNTCSNVHTRLGIGSGCTLRE